MTGPILSILTFGNLKAIGGLLKLSNIVEIGADEKSLHLDIRWYQL